MRKLTLIMAAAGTALAFAAPASAQYAPQYQPQYAPQNSAYGYNNGYARNSYGQVRAMQARIDGIQRQIQNLKARRMISRNEASGLRSESRSLESRLARAARYGLNPNEARDIGYRIARLESHVAHEARDGGRYTYNNGAYGYGNNNAYYADRDRNGRDRHDD